MPSIFLWTLNQRGPKNGRSAQWLHSMMEMQLSANEALDYWQALRWTGEQLRVNLAFAQRLLGSAPAPPWVQKMAGWIPDRDDETKTVFSYHLLRWRPLPALLKNVSSEVRLQQEEVAERVDSGCADLCSCCDPGRRELSRDSHGGLELENQPLNGFGEHLRMAPEIPVALIVKAVSQLLHIFSAYCTDEH